MLGLYPSEEYNPSYIQLYSDGCRTNIQLFDFYLMQRENFDI